jgi:hypothetical protein
MSKAKNVIGISLAVIVAVSIWMAVASNPIIGIAFFFILTGLLWAMAKTRHWI